MEKVYIDSNIFVYGFTDGGKKGVSARTFLNKVSEGKIRAHTATLTFDEVSWKLLKLLDRTLALEAMKKFLTFPFLTFLDVDKGILQESCRLIEHQKLLPRDAIHAAACFTNNITTIVSEDKDFDAVKGLHRKALA
ncbi:MAG: type II toxin-antitoxin system VapC family toxin [Candidatus Woesearchaeota archaeon]|nr:type II toxin-antitoxin system VapC family toxin [Candidatus Woesearchaeota archaeon]